MWHKITHPGNKKPTNTKKNKRVSCLRPHSWQTKRTFLWSLFACSLPSLKIAQLCQTAPTQVWIISAVWKQWVCTALAKSSESNNIHRQVMWPRPRRWGRADVKASSWCLQDVYCGQCCTVQVHTLIQARQWLTNTLIVTTSSDRATQAPPLSPPFPPTAALFLQLHPSSCHVFFLSGILLLLSLHSGSPFLSLRDHPH